MSGVVRVGCRDIAVYISDTLQSEWVLSQALLFVISFILAMFLAASFRSLSVLFLLLSDLFLIILVSCCFQLCQVMLLFLETTDTKRSLKVWRKARPNIVEWHHRLWPGIHIETLHSKYVKNQNDQESHTWFKEATINTSMLVSTVCNLLNNKHRSLVSRAEASSGFAKLILLFCQVLDGVELTHERFTTDRDVNARGQGSLLVDSFGKVDSSAFWSSDFWTTNVKKAWKSDFLNKGKTWINQIDGGGDSVPLVSLLSFALDPQRVPSLSSLLMTGVLNLLTEISFIIDTSVPHVLRDAAQLEADALIKSAKRFKRVIVSVLAETVANEIWSGRVTCLSILFYKLLDRLFSRLYNTSKFTTLLGLL